MTDMSDSGDEGRSDGDAGAPVERRPPAHAGWAVVALLFFWPLSFAAFTHAFEVYPRWSDGDRDGARQASNRVRWLGQVSLWIGGSIAVVLLVLYVLVSAVWIDAHHDHGISPSFTGPGYCDFGGGDFGGGDFGGGDFGADDGSFGW
ncbi:CD225/dispanin family protein [Rhodococcus hoagii]|nr:CD225/dispanin family protein [Prescottella equi]